MTGLSKVTLNRIPIAKSEVPIQNMFCLVDGLFS